MLDACTRINNLVSQAEGALTITNSNLLLFIIKSRFPLTEDKWSGEETCKNPKIGRSHFILKSILRFLKSLKIELT